MILASIQSHPTIHFMNSSELICYHISLSLMHQFPYLIALSSSSLRICILSVLLRTSSYIFHLILFLLCGLTHPCITRRSEMMRIMGIVHNLRQLSVLFYIVTLCICLCLSLSHSTWAPYLNHGQIKMSISMFDWGS